MMRINTLPQPVLARLITMDDHAEALARAAALADDRLAQCRATLRGDFQKTGIMKDDAQVVARAQANFESIHKNSQEARRRADAAMRVASSVKAFIAGLLGDAELEVVEPVVADGIDLALVRSKIAGLRAELGKIRNQPLPAPDIKARVRDYIDALARGGRPLIRGFEAGRELNISWPMATTADRKNGNGFDDRQANALLLMALLQPAALSDYLLAQIDAMTNELMPASERGPRLAQLETELTEWLRLDVHFVDQAIAAGATDVGHDPETPPAILLSIAVVDAANATQRLAS